MTPRTRSSNQDANFKVYYSKKVPQQVRFPHKRKTVRRPSTSAKDDSDKRQMRFLPEKMSIRKDVEDSEQEEDDDMEDGGVLIGSEAGDRVEEKEESRGKIVETRGIKREREAMDRDSEDDEEPVRPTPKRTRKATGPKSNRRSKQIKPEPEDEDNATLIQARRNVDRARTLRRQSTMTQLVERRRPLSDTDEPAYRPFKRTSRLSWSGQGKKEKDKNQRTLTQMVLGMKPLEIVSDDDMEEELSDVEAQERDSQAYGEAIAARLAQEGLIQDRSDDVEETGDQKHAPRATSQQENNRERDEVALPAHSLHVPSLVVQSVEDEDDEDHEESYQPTQFIDAPITRTSRATRRTSGTEAQVALATEAPPTALRRTAKSRFSLLSTPEKRRIREIPSSQSPSDSPLSTQVTPSKAHRPPLQEFSGNTTQAAETPSKRKQVTFQIPTKDQVPPPSLRKFRSVIQDSEDEEEDPLEADENDSGHHIDAHTQALNQGMDNAAPSEAVGKETQVMLDQIDRACANADEDAEWNSWEPSEELGIFPRGHIKPSPELGEQLEQHIISHTESSLETSSPYRKGHVGVKQEDSHDVDVPDHPGPRFSLEEDDEGISAIADAEPASASIEPSVSTTQVPSSPPIIQQVVEDTCPSTPMVIMDSSDEEEDPDPTPPHQSTHEIIQPSLNALQQSADLDGEPIQVPQSPSAQHETQQSHSSKAELQLQNEWFSYSQYVNARPPQSSSMNVAHDRFSYHATPMPPRPIAQPQPPGFHMSQATTVDEVTPRKNRTQHTISANTTPHKIASSQPFWSPSKPPPLVIPSSFPSPAKARMEEWSSPLFGITQDTYGATYAGGSLEDFSIPLPPPVEDD